MKNQFCFASTKIIKNREIKVYLIIIVEGFDFSVFNQMRVLLNYKQNWFFFLAFQLKVNLIYREKTTSCKTGTRRMGRKCLLN
jgi:hypothetical protein